MSNDGIKGYFDFSVTGADKVAALEARLTEVERHLGGSLPAAAAKANQAAGSVGAAHAISGGKLAKYSSTLSVITGQTQTLGVQNTALTRIISLGTEAFTGMLGPVGLLGIAIGSVVTAIGFLVNKEREKQQVMKEGTEATLKAIDANIKLAALSNPSGAIAQTYLVRTAEQARNSVFDLEQRQRDIFNRQQAGGATNQVGIVGPGFPVKTQFVPFSLEQMAKLDKEASETAIALIIARENEIKIKLANQVGPAIGLMRTDFKAETADATDALIKQALGIQVPLGGAPLEMFNTPEGSARKTTRGINLEQGGAKHPAVSIYDQMSAAGISAYEIISTAATQSAEQQGAAFDWLVSKHQAAWSAMQGMTQSTQKAASLFVQRAIEGENVSRLKGLTVARYVASGALAAVLNGMAKEAEERAGMEAIHAIAAAASGNFGSAALHTAAAAGYGALGGVASGLAAGIQSTAQRQFDAETRSTESAYGSTGSSSASAASNPGVRVAASGASVGTLNYNFIVTYNGATVYGDGGTRDWFYRELVPLINEGMSTGAVSRN